MCSVCREVSAEINAAFVDVLAKDPYGDKSEKTKRCLELIRKGVDVNTRGTYVQTPLQMAAEYGMQEVVEEMLRRGVLVNRYGSYGDTALMCAASSGRLEIAKLLIAAGAEPNVVGTQQGVTALINAAIGGHTELAVLLVASGADPKYQAVGLRSFAEKPTAAALAEVQGHPETAKAIRAAAQQYKPTRGADPNFVPPGAYG